MNNFVNYSCDGISCKLNRTHDCVQCKYIFIENNTVILLALHYIPLLHVTFLPISNLCSGLLFPVQKYDKPSRNNIC